MSPQNIKIKCPKCRNSVIENAREGAGRLVTRFKQTQRKGNQLIVQCRSCNTWIKIPNNLI